MKAFLISIFDLCLSNCLIDIILRIKYPRNCNLRRFKFGNVISYYVTGKRNDRMHSEHSDYEPLQNSDSSYNGTITNIEYAHVPGDRGWRCNGRYYSSTEGVCLEGDISNMIFQVLECRNDDEGKYESSMNRKFAELQERIDAIEKILLIDKNNPNKQKPRSGSRPWSTLPHNQRKSSLKNRRPSQPTSPAVSYNLPQKKRNTEDSSPSRHVGVRCNGLDKDSLDGVRNKCTICLDDTTCKGCFEEPNNFEVVKESGGILKDLGLNVKLQAKKLSIIFDLDFAHKGFLDVDFGSTLKLKHVQKQPDVKMPSTRRSQYVTLAMVDPDSLNVETPLSKVAV